MNRLIQAYEQPEEAFSEDENQNKFPEGLACGLLTSDFRTNRTLVYRSNEVDVNSLPLPVARPESGLVLSRLRRPMTARVVLPGEVQDK